MRLLLLAVFALCLVGDVWVQPVAAAPAHRLRVATLAPTRSALGRAYVLLNRDLLKHTNGEVGVRLYAGGAAGDERTVVRKMRVGQLDGAMLTTSGLGALVRQVLVLEAPGLITSYLEVDKVRTVLANELEELFKKEGYTLIAWGDAGRIRLFSKHRIERPADLQKVRPWVWRDSPTMRAFIKATGANGVSLGLPEVYPALQTNMIDTVISSSIGVVGFQWHTRLNTMTKQASGIVVGAFIVRTDRLEALPKEAQEYILETSRNTEAAFRQSGRKLDDEATIALEKRLEVVDMEPHRRAWEAAMSRARTSLAGRLYSKALLDRVEKIVTAP